MSKFEPSDNAVRFVGRLRQLRDRRELGPLAALRRGFDPSNALRTCPAWSVVRSLGGDIGKQGDSAYVRIAALFATHTKESGACNFGETSLEIALADAEDKTEIPKSFETRFRRLLASSDAKDLAGQLRSWVRLAASRQHPVGINYERLFDDVAWWDRSADRIRVRWACSFWRSGSDADATANTETSNQPATV